jgi:hypothetical protein
MRLSDHIIAEVGKTNDVAGIFTSMAKAVSQAQRFELSDDVAVAAYRLTTSKPTTLLNALPLVRTPYRKMWLEWRGGATTRTGMIRPQNRRDQDIAPDPLKQGVLIETDETGQRGVMTFAWIHDHRPKFFDSVMPTDASYSPVNIGPLGTLFNWEEGAIVLDDAMRTLRERYKSDAERKSPGGMMDLLMISRYSKEMSDEDLKAWMERSMFHDWSRHADKAGERQALAQLNRHAMPFVSPHAVGFLEWCAKQAFSSPTKLRNFMEMVVRQSWEADIEGEAPMAETVMALMNSKNAVEYHDVDLKALNKSRAKMKRQQFLPYRVTDLRLSQAQRRAFHAGLITREQAGLHSVRGHFKVRRTGVYWWHPFERGDPSKPLQRKEYSLT